MSYPFDPFAECAQLQKTECFNGLTYKELAKTAFSVFNKCLGNAPQELRGDADSAPWEAVAGKGAQILDLPESEQASREVSASSLAKTLYMQYNVEIGREPDWKWDSQKPTSKIAWEAVGRHLLNLIDSDGKSLDFQDLEERIVQWARRRVESTQIVCG